QRGEPGAALLVAVCGGTVLPGLAAAVPPRGARGADGAAPRQAGPRAPRGPASRGAVVVGSLWYSVYYTHANPAGAYFVTTTRIWELGLGGLLALLPAGLSTRVGRFGLLGWAGLGLVIASAFVLSGTDAFPGYLALLPAGGAAALILGGSAAGRFGPHRLTSMRPMVFVGGISYSLYLWHWPLIV